MHLVKRQGDNIGALALIVIDNPMCAGTGHRICNDCMKGCIYQKTEPVDIPQIETNVLTDVLFMPYGFEIYSLLTRWNPLNVRRPYALPYHGTNALVVGLGPAGYTLAHYLLNEGFGVVGIDALKIEPLPAELLGDGEHPPKPIKDFRALYEELDKRMLAGLRRRRRVRHHRSLGQEFPEGHLPATSRAARASAATAACVSAERLTIEDAWELGFDHIAIATGAGKPTIIDIKNNLMRGIRKASDFSDGPAADRRREGVVARESAGAAAGRRRRRRFDRDRYGDGAHGLLPDAGRKAARALRATLRWPATSRRCAATSTRKSSEILDEFLGHGRAMREERRRAAAARRRAELSAADRSLGRRHAVLPQEHRVSRPRIDRITRRSSRPSRKGSAWPRHGSARRDRGRARSPARDALRASSRRPPSSTAAEEAEVEVPLRSLFVAAGTSPNTIYEQEHPGTFATDGKFFQRYEPRWNRTRDRARADARHDVAQNRQARAADVVSQGRQVHQLLWRQPSGLRGQRREGDGEREGRLSERREAARSRIRAADPIRQAERDASLRALFARLDDLLVATVVAVKRLTPTIIEVVARAPMAAKRFEPGRFYRAQSFESGAPQVDGTVLATEGIALTGAWVDKDVGLISLITLEMGTSSRLCARVETRRSDRRHGRDRVSDRDPAGKTVLLAGGGLGNAVLFSIGKAMRAAGNRVIYFAGYRNARRSIQGRGRRSSGGRRRLGRRSRARRQPLAHVSAAGLAAASATSSTRSRRTRKASSVRRRFR